jgi:hypothetical protein
MVTVGTDHGLAPGAAFGYTWRLSGAYQTVGEQSTEGTRRMRQHHQPATHAYVPELQEQLRKGGIDRREFLRTATLLSG